MLIVYLATGPTGKQYVGVTSRGIEVRKSQHQHYAVIKRLDTKFYRAIRKYGFQNFSWTILHRCTSTEEMNAREIAEITLRDTYHSGYNSTIGGEGANGYRKTPEQLEKHTIAQRARFQRHDQRAHAAKTVTAFVAENPELHYEYAERRKRVLRSAPLRQSASKKQSAYAAANPGAMAARGEKLSQTFKDNPEIRKRISRALGGKPIEVIKDGKVIATFDTKGECARTLGVNGGNISFVLRGKREYAGGYQFRYQDSTERQAVLANTHNGAGSGVARRTRTRRVGSSTSA